MNPEYEDTLTQVFSEVLEQLAFMFVEPPDSEEAPAPENPVAATMSFRGPRAGSVTLAVPRGMAPVLAANVLGLDPDDELTPRAADDALKELLNVICGNVLTAIAGDEPVFDLTVPEIRAYSAEDWEALARRTGTAHCLADEFPVLLNLEIGE